MNRLLEVRLDVRSDHNLVYSEAVRQWGEESQIEMMREECAELLLELSRVKRNRSTKLMIAEELADVEIMLEQMKLIFGRDRVHRFKMEKLTRLANMLGFFVAR